MIDVESGIVLRQIGITGVAEDGLDEIEIGRQAAGGQEAQFHALPRLPTGDLGNNRGPQQQTDPGSRRTWGVMQVGQQERLGGRRQGMAEQRRPDMPGHFGLVRRHRQAAIGQMKHTLGRAPVVARVVQHPLADPVGIDVRRMILIPVRRQRQLARQTVVVEGERARWQLRVLIFRQPGGIGVEKSLDAAIHRVEVIGKQTLLLPVVGQQVVGDLEELDILRPWRDAEAEGGQLEIQVSPQLLPMLGQVGNAETEGALQVHYEWLRDGREMDS